jgi:hypothetical protein
MKVGFIVALTGVILVATSLVFTMGLNDAERGLIENLHKEGIMYIILNKGEYVTNQPQKVYMDSGFDPSNYSGESLWQKDEKGYYVIKRYTGWKGTVTIPTKYPYWASVIIIIIGLANIVISFSSKYSSKAK